MTDRPKILIVDDEPFNVDYLEQELEDMDFDTISAANGREALDKVVQENPDLLLLDIMMPVMDGFEVLRQLKMESEWRDIPVIIISALTDMDSVIKGIELGAEDYLPKPFNPTLLNARINAGLNRKRLRDLEKAYLLSLERELEIGHRIQAGFLPRQLLRVDGWELAAYFQAANEVAGDFYDVFSMPDGCIGFFLGDVADKGVGSALFMALYRSLLRAFINADNYMGEDQLSAVPADCLINAVARTNRYVCQTHEGALFATLFMGILNPSTGEFHYINAGHNPPMVLNGSHIRLNLMPTGPGLGILEEMNYQVQVEKLAPGELMVIYSDGVEDTQNGQGEFYGDQSLRDLISQSEISASNLVQNIVKSLANFRGETNQFDDVTLLVIGRQS